MFFKSIVLAGTVILVQQSASLPLRVDQLHEATNRLLADVKATGKMELDGCMRTDRSSGGTSCYYKMPNGVPLKAWSYETTGPLKGIEAELSLDTAGADKLIGTAKILALTLIPNLSKADYNTLVEELTSAKETIAGNAVRRQDKYTFMMKLDAKLAQLRIIVD